jgi:hypothetical protein
MYINYNVSIFYSTALVFCRDSGTEIFVRDYDTPLISAPAEAEPLLDTRPENSEEVEGLVMRV